MATIINYQELNKMCLQWAQMTEVNNHTGVLLSISNYFGFSDLIKTFEQIKKDHDKIGYCRFDLFIDRLNAEKELFRQIKQTYGEIVHDLIYKCC